MSGNDGHVTREIQDLATAVSEIPTAVREVAAAAERAAAERAAAEKEAAPLLALQIPAPVFQVPQAPAPTVMVNVPPAPPPEITVQAPNVQVAGTRVNVEAPAPVAYRVTILERDSEGRLKEFVVVPVQVVE